MERERIVEFSAAVALAILATALLRPSPSVAQSVSLAPSTMPRIGSVSERYQSYNVEMIEVTGGRFWKPYGPEPDRILQQPAPDAGAPGADTPAGMNADLYQYRPPIDLDNARLRKLAAALGPAYVRVSGTWANTTYFSATDQPPAAAPAGFKGVLSRPQWKGVVDFAQAVNAQIVTSFATGAGTRDAAGVWTAEQAGAAGRLHQRDRRPHRRGRVHERAEPRRHGWGAGRLRRRRLRPRLQALPCLRSGGCARHADPRPGVGRRDRRRTGPVRRTGRSRRRATC